jgi:hypothetical protein
MRLLRNLPPVSALRNESSERLLERRHDMSICRRTILTSVLGLFVLTGISLFASSYQDEESSYSPEGAWLMNGVVAGQPYLWMDTYTSNSTKPGISGTVLCTMPGSIATQSGHGTWIRIAKNAFAITTVRILIGPDGQPAGTAKFWGTVKVRADEMSGTLSAQYFSLSGDPISPVIGPGTSTGKRIEVTVEDQQ